MNKKIFIIVGIAVFLIASIALVAILKTKKTTTTNEKIKIVWWQPFDNEEAVKPLIDDYQKAHPNVEIDYVKKNYKSLDDYQNKVVNAIANNEAPDIWSLKNDWLPMDYKKLAPLPEKVISKSSYENTFFPIIKSDMAIKSNGQESIYGIPFSLDTLVLIYNSDIFQKNNIDAPTTWKNFITGVQKLTQRDGDNIQRAGAALGTANNITHNFDILSLLMLQNKTNMVSENKDEVYFNRSEERDGKTYYPGTSALKFYTDFALPQKTAYTWNNAMPSDVEAFISGKTAMVFGYSQDIATIKKRAPQLRFNTATIPQVNEGDNIAYASFWSEVVSSNSKNQATAWDFLKFCIQKDNINKYYSKKNEAEEYTSSSIMSIAKNQETRQYIGPIAKQSSYAQSWYEGDANQMQDIFTKMINSVLSGQPPQASIDAAAKSANDMLNNMQ